MNFIVTTVAVLYAAALAIAAPSLSSDMQALDNAMEKLHPRDYIDSCDDCGDHLDMCITYGMAEGILGCEDVCMSRLCRKWPECRECDEEFDHCTDRDV